MVKIETQNDYVALCKHLLRLGIKYYVDMLQQFTPGQLTPERSYAAKQRILTLA